MAVKPILFNTEMVQAILTGQKTTTRRVVKLDFQRIYGLACAEGLWNESFGHNLPEVPQRFIDWYVSKYAKAPYQVGDILYVRETWYRDEKRYIYKANYSANAKFYQAGKEVTIKWEPSIHMPKEAARIWLEVTTVKVERLQNITEEQAKAEGGVDNRSFIHSPENEHDLVHTARQDFVRIWDSTVKKSDLDRYGWVADPWVWVIEFERVGKEGEKCQK